MKKIIILAMLFACGIAHAQTYPSPTFGNLTAKGSISGDVSPSIVLSSGSTSARSLAARFKDRVYAADYGVVCDYNFTTKTGTDNTAALQRAITAAVTQGTMGVGYVLVLPTGNCLTGTVNIIGSIRVIGSHALATVLVLASGVNGPLLNVAPVPSYNFPADGYPPAEIDLENFRITSQDGAANNATYPNANGITVALPVGSLETFGYVSHVTAYNMPGAGIYGAGPNGYFTVENFTSWGNGAQGMSTNTTSDWSLIGGQLAENKKEGYLSSGDSQLTFDHVNSFSNAYHGVRLFGRETVNFTGHNEFNLNGKAGLQLDSLTSDSLIRSYGNLTLSANSQSAIGSYSNLQTTSNSQGVVILRNELWGTSSAGGDSSASALYDFHQESGSTTEIYCDDCVFLLGSPIATGVTNDPAHFHATSPTSLGWVNSGISSLLTNSAVAAAGTTRATATVLAAQNNVVTSGTGGVALPTSTITTYASGTVNVTGTTILVMNRSGAAITVYPNGATSTIEMGTAGAGVPLASGASASFVQDTATDWRMK